MYWECTGDALLLNIFPTAKAATVTIYVRDRYRAGLESPTARQVRSVRECTRPAPAKMLGADNSHLQRDWHRNNVQHPPEHQLPNYSCFMQMKALISPST